MTKGYAVLDADGHILINTVSETARGAKVNWLYTVGGLRVLDDWPDAKIIELFERLRDKSELVEVQIKLRRHA